jgi:transposase
MQITLAPLEKEKLESQHRKERDKHICDRIKAVLLSSESWTIPMISQALRIHVETVRRHLKDYQDGLKLKPENGGSSELLSEKKLVFLIDHIEQAAYVRVSDICFYVKEKFQITYTVAGMTKWLHRHGFSYKKPKETPAKADGLAQKTWIEAYKKFLTTTPKDEPVLFGDGVHPTMATKVTYGWIRKGRTKLIETTASRTRMNLFGGLNLKTMTATIASYKTLNQESMTQYFAILKKQYPNARQIHIILDQGPYNKAIKTKEAARKFGIVLHYLPTYSPNLNPIERLWKVMNEHVRNNVFFKSAKEFREAILTFFEKTWPQIAQSMKNRINDNFQIIKPASSG